MGHVEQNIQRMLLRIVDRLNSAKPVGDGSYMALCPFHEDKGPSLRVGGGDGYYCYGCGKQGYLGELAEQLGIVDPEYFKRKPDYGRSHYSGGGGGRHRGKVVAQYIYRDEDRTPLYRIVRYEPKAFEMQAAILNGKFLYGWRIGRGSMKDVRRILYRLPEILATDINIPIIIVEGEKDADRLYELGFMGTSIAGGVFGNEAGIFRCLHGRTIVVIPDDDHAGYDYGGRLLEGLADTAKRVVELVPYGSRGETKRDVTDWLEAGGTREELKRLIKEALE